MKKIKCPCGKEKKYKGCGSNVGDVVKQTGFHALLTHRGGILYLCSKCFSEAQEHAEAIMKIVKNRYLYFPRLLKRETLEEERRRREND